MDLSGEQDSVELLSRRLDFLQFLTDSADKPAMVESLGYSRSTVDRAVRSLRDAGFVEWVEPGYETTLAGRLALERYEQFLGETETLVEARRVLNTLPSDIPLSSSALLDAETSSAPNADEPLSLPAGAVPDAERYRALLPSFAVGQHLRQLHGAAAGGVAVMLVSGAGIDDRLTARSATHVLGQNSTTVLAGEEPDFGLVIVNEGSESATVVLLAYDDEHLVGTLRSTDGALLEWATERFEAAASAADDVTAAVRARAAEATAAQSGDDTDVATLRSQGFERVDEQYFGNRAALDPTTAWQAGLRLPEIGAGYAVERTTETDDGREPFVPRLLDHLADGRDVALLGAPGSGKSTVCMQAACEWFDAGRGPVYYRESGQGQPFENVPALVDSLTDDAGHALVVVEDAVRGEANAVFEAMDRLDDATVSFLLDAREGEWRDPDDLPVDRNLERFRQEDVTIVRMPPLDEHEQQAILDRFEAVADVPVDGARDRLLEPTAGDDHTASAGEIFLLFHRLARYADPFAGGESRALTTLDEHVDSVRERVAEAGEDALDVAVMANVLNAAGLGVYPEYLDAMVAGTDVDGTAVERALDVLDGEMLFEDSEDGPYRTVHGVWSVRFLERLLDAEGEEAAEARFGRGLTALLALADDEQKRAAVGIGSLDDPSEWADDVVRQVFDLGVSYPKLAALFGTTDSSSLVLPEVCSREARLYQSIKRGEMYFHSANTELAGAEYERIVSSLSDQRTALEGSTLKSRFYARALLGLSDVKHTSDEQEALEYGQKALEVFDDVGDRRGRVIARIKLSLWESIMGSKASARQHVTEALSIAGSNTELEAYCRFGLGQLLGRSGNVEDGMNELRRSVRIALDLGSELLELWVLSELTNFSRDLGNLSQALEYGRRWLEHAREIGDIHDVLSAHNILLLCNIDTGHLKEAQQHAEHGSELLSGAQIDGEATHGWMQGYLSRLQGDCNRAREQLRSTIELCQDNDLIRHEAIAHLHLAWTLLDMDEIQAATEHANRAVELGVDIDSPQVTGYARVVRGLVAIETDNLTEATEQFETAIDLCDPEIPSTAAMGRRGLGDVSRARDRAERAIECYESALETFRETGKIRFALETVEDLAELSSDPEPWYETGAEIAAEADLDDRVAAFRERARQHDTD